MLVPDTLTITALKPNQIQVSLCIASPDDEMVANAVAPATIADYRDWLTRKHLEASDPQPDAIVKG